MQKVQIKNMFSKQFIIIQLQKSLIFLFSFSFFPLIKLILFLINYRYVFSADTREYMDVWIEALTHATMARVARRNFWL